MQRGPEEVSARPLPLVVIVASLACSASFLYSLTLDGPLLATWFDRWGLVSRTLVRDIDGARVGWRLLTPFTAVGLHATLVHLVTNLFYFWLFGEALEAALGRVRFTLLLLSSAAAAGAAHVLAEPNAFVPAIGASGVVSGLLGAYLLVHRRTSLRLRWHPAGLSPLVFFAVWCAFVALAQWSAPEGLATGSHLGGFVAGAAFAGLLVWRAAPPEPA